MFLFIYLPKISLINADQKVSWQLWDKKKHSLEESGLASLNDISSIASSAETSSNILIVPGEEVRSLNVKLPNKSKAALSTIPFQLEEHLSSKLEDLHIASGNANNLHVTSLATQKTLMEQWLQLMQSAAIKISYLVPDYSLLPVNSQMGTVWQENNRVVINSAEFQGAMSEYAFKLNQKKLWPSTSNQPEFYRQGYASDFSAHSKPHDLLSSMAETFTTLHSKSLINLLKGPFEQKNPNQLQLRKYKPLIISTALLCIGILTVAILDNLQLKEKNSQLQIQMVQLYKQLFPQDKRITAPYQQMRGKLKSQSGKTGDNFLVWLSIISPVLQQQGITLVNLKYDDNPRVLRMQVEAKSYIALESLIERVNQHADKRITATLGTLQKSPNNQSVTSILTLKEM